MTTHPVLLALLPITLSGPASVPAPADDCEHTAERTAVVPAAGARLARVRAAAGGLRIEGRSGLSEVRVRGVACASDRRYLDDVRLLTERSGDEVRVEARLPEAGWLDRFQARLDLVLEVPEQMALDILDSSGGIEIRNVGPVTLEDSSGGIEIERVTGDVRVDDSSGDLHVRLVSGDLRITDSSGGLNVREVMGSVLIEEDGSGDIDVQEVRRDVVVRRDSSGGISVSRIGGDFTVSRDGSGGIRHREVAGAVRVPGR